MTATCWCWNDPELAPRGRYCRSCSAEIAGSGDYPREMLRHARRQLQEAQDLIVDALDSIRLARSERETLGLPTRVCAPPFDWAHHTGDDAA